MNYPGILPCVEGRRPWQQSTAKEPRVRWGASHSSAATHTRVHGSDQNMWGW